MTKKMSLKEKQRLEREQLILECAERILLDKGYHDMNMDEIAAAVGIAKGTLYLHFPKKEDLAFALVKPKILSFLESVEEAKAHPGDAKEKLLFLLKREMSGSFFQFLLKGSPDMTSIFRTRQEEVNQILADIFKGIHQILEEGRRKGVFDSDLPIEFMSTSFVNLFDPHLYKEMVEVRKMPIEEFHHHLANLYFRGIMKSGA